MVFPFAASSPPASHGGVNFNMSGFLRSPYKPWTAVAIPRGMDAASSNEIEDGFYDHDL